MIDLQCLLFVCLCVSQELKTLRDRRERMNPDKRKPEAYPSFTRNQEEGELLVSNFKMLLVLLMKILIKSMLMKKINIPSKSPNEKRYIFRSCDLCAFYESQAYK